MGLFEPLKTLVHGERTPMLWSWVITWGKSAGLSGQPIWTLGLCPLSSMWKMSLYMKKLSKYTKPDSIGNEGNGSMRSVHGSLGITDMPSTKPRVTFLECHLREVLFLSKFVHRSFME